MARHIVRFYSPFSPQQVNDFFISYMNGEGFKITTRKGESFWKKGVGLLTAPQFIKLTQQNNVYTLEAWLPFAVLPGTYIGEMDLKGFVGCLPKSFLEARVNQILSTLQAQPIQPMQGMPNMQPNMQGNYQSIPNNMPQAQGNYNGNPQHPVQSNYNSNPNAQPQMQGANYANPNTPRQMPNAPVVQNGNNQPFNQYNQGR